MLRLRLSSHRFPSQLCRPGQRLSSEWISVFTGIWKPFYPTPNIEYFPISNGATIDSTLSIDLLVFVLL
jgi:hypothetical protein